MHTLCTMITYVHNYECVYLKPVSAEPQNWLARGNTYQPKVYTVTLQQPHTACYELHSGHVCVLISLDCI